MLALIIAAVAPGAPVVRGQTPALSTKTYKFTNGRWFDGKGFRSHTFYSADGVLTSKKTRHVDETIDLKNGYVVPPFGEAHNHNIDTIYNVDAFVRRYLTDGIFYVKNPNNLRRFSEKILPKLNQPSSLDAVFANGGMTAMGGHPTAVYDYLASGPYKFAAIERMEDEAYFYIDDARDLQAK